MESDKSMRPSRRSILLGVFLSLGGLSILLGYHPTIGAALVIFLLAAAFRHTQFLEGRGDDSFPEEHGHSWFAVDDLSHPATLADKSWALTRKPESFVLEGASWSSLSLAGFFSARLFAWLKSSLT
jgi:hypothetical protein